MARHNDLGTWGEQMAVDYLESKGYTVRDRNKSFKKDELDIVAISPDGTELVFIEVKTRTSEEFQEPELAVDRRKIRNLGRAADDYLKREAMEMYARFDIITIVGTIGCTSPIITHLEDVPLYNRI